MRIFANSKYIKFPFGLMSKLANFSIIHEDEDIVVINKSSHILSIPDRYKPDLANVYMALREKYGDIYVVHRLDKDTSGIMVFARNEEAHRNLSKQFEERSTEKKYLALVLGVPHEKEGLIDIGIDANPSKAGQMICTKNGKPSQTEYQLKEVFKNYALVECKILTGRTHQIRVHMKYLGFPMAVDPFYSPKSALFLSDFKKRKFKIGKYDEEQPMLSRVPLHSYSLQFCHPSKGEKVSYQAELPKDFEAVLSQLRKWNAI